MKKPLFPHLFNNLDKTGNAIRKAKAAPDLTGAATDPATDPARDPPTDPPIDPPTDTATD